jgi:DNA-binding protein HU-beta
MNRREIIERIADCAGLTMAQAGRAFDCYINIVQGALRKNKIVHLSGLGTFTVAKRSARTLAVPMTGKIIKKAAKSIKFKPSVTLKRKI